MSDAFSGGLLPQALPQSRFASKAGSALSIASVVSQGAGLTTPVTVKLSQLTGAFAVQNPITSVNKPTLLILQYQLSGLLGVAGRASITITDSTGFRSYGAINVAVPAQNGIALEVAMFELIVDNDSLIINLITDGGNAGNMSLVVALYGWLH